MSDEQERAYMRGHRDAWLGVLQTALRELGYPPELNAASFVAAREDALRALRRVCEDHGDNDWPDTLSLADAIEKHLAPYLDADESEGEP